MKLALTVTGIALVLASCGNSSSKSTVNSQKVSGARDFGLIYVGELSRDDAESKCLSMEGRLLPAYAVKDLARDPQRLIESTLSGKKDFSTSGKFFWTTDRDAIPRDMGWVVFISSGSTNDKVVSLIRPIKTEFSAVCERN
jgi:hypothetical protein